MQTLNQFNREPKHKHNLRQANGAYTNRCRS